MATPERLPARSVPVELLIPKFKADFYLIFFGFVGSKGKEPTAEKLLLLKAAAQK